MKLKLTYLTLFLLTAVVAFLTPKDGGYIIQPEVINLTNAVLFTLLVYLIAKVLRMGRTAMEVAMIALAVLLLSPDATDFLTRAEDGALELCSICIALFFLSQYNRINAKNFRKGYAIMFLMGIFCSYTHDGISLPLCISFLWLSYKQRKAFFMRACWPMVIGFLIGTVLLLASRNTSLDELHDWHRLSHQTITGVGLLWDTKVFIFTIILTAYFVSTKRRTRIVSAIIRRNRLVALCLMFTLCTMPFSPLGLENSVSGVCFFALLWFLLLCKVLMEMWDKKRREEKARLRYYKEVDAPSDEND